MAKGLLVASRRREQCRPQASRRAQGVVRADGRRRQWERLEYGGITPVGLPVSWPLLIGAAVVGTPVRPHRQAIRGYRRVGRRGAGRAIGR